MADRDFKRLAVLIDIALTTKHDGEADNAVRQARRIAAQTGLRAADLLEGFEQRFALLDAAKGLSDEVDRLRLQVEQLKARTTGGGALAQACGPIPERRRPSTTGTPNGCSAWGSTIRRRSSASSAAAPDGAAR